jgi:hypothetical protein
MSSTMPPGWPLVIPRPEGSGAALLAAIGRCGKALEYNVHVTPETRCHADQKDATEGHCLDCPKSVRIPTVAFLDV